MLKYASYVIPSWMFVEGRVAISPVRKSNIFFTGKYGQFHSLKILDGKNKIVSLPTKLSLNC